MEKKNPFEEVRTAILASQLLGIENEVSELGISDELLDICDAIDDYYGIKKKPVTQYPSDTNDNNHLLLRQSQYEMWFPQSIHIKGLLPPIIFVHMIFSQALICYIAI